MRWERETWSGEEKKEAWKGASAVDDVDGIFSAERKSALVLMVGNFLRKEDSTGACTGKGWEKRGMKGRVFMLSAARKWLTHIPEERNRLEMARQ